MLIATWFLIMTTNRNLETGLFQGHQVVWEAETYTEQEYVTTIIQ